MLSIVEQTMKKCVGLTYHKIGNHTNLKYDGARDHFKNGVSLKSQMSRGNFLKIKKYQIPMSTKIVYQEYSNTPIYRVEGNKIYQGYSGALAYRIDGNMIYQEYSNTPVYRIDGNMIYQGYENTPIYRIEGNRIYQGHSGALVYRID